MTAVIYLAASLIAAVMAILGTSDPVLGVSLLGFSLALVAIGLWFLAREDSR